MSMFERPGSMEAIKEWNDSREERAAAKRAYDAARERLWNANVRMAKAHKNAENAVGAEYAHRFLWIDSLDGNRDEILACAEAANAGPNAGGERSDD